SHQTDRVFRADRIDDAESAPPRGCLRRVCLATRELMQRRCVLPSKRRTFAIGPTLELDRIRKKEAVEERTRIERGRILEAAVRDRGDEVRALTRQSGGVHTDFGGALERVVAENLAKRVQCLRERAASLLRLGLGPEVREQLVARDAPFPGGVEQREERETSPL